MRASSTFALIPLVFTFACGDTAEAPPTDTFAVDTSADVAQEVDDDVPAVPPDAALDVPADTAVDAEADATTEVGPEVAEDTASDVGDDTSSEVGDGTDTTGASDSNVEPGLPLAGFGAISGDCGFLDTELFEAAPSFFVNAIDFGSDPYDDSDLALLLPDSREMIDDGNAGGSSVMSEVFALEVLERCELATLIATETEIIYDVQGKITDILVGIDGERVGVSVTRAVGFPFDAPYTVEQATSILKKKLGDILVSSANVSSQHEWVKQILHVLAYGDGHVASLETAWNALPAETRADTIVIVTVTHGDDAFIY